MKRALFVLPALALVAGCVHTGHLDQVRYGMSESEVVALMGQPESSTHSPGRTCSTYVVVKDFWSRTPWTMSDRYSVCYVDGRVDTFGKADQPDVRASQLQ